MKLPDLQGNFTQSGFCLYAAADQKYFDEYGRALVNSVLRNTPHGIHLHIYDPTAEQLAWCNSHDRVSVTWEHLSRNQFDEALDFWCQLHLPEPYQGRKNKMLGIKSALPMEAGPEAVKVWLYKTYYACMRFVRLAEMLPQAHALLSIDIDGIVRKDFATSFPDNRDIYLYEKPKGGHLAGAILLSGNQKSLEFVRDLAQRIRHEIISNNIYWFLDQNCLDQTVDSYRKGILPINYIDWYMGPDSAIWSAKGKRKHLQVFQQEKLCYQ
jgi:hypothetical protein